MVYVFSIFFTILIVGFRVSLIINGSILHIFSCIPCLEFLRLLLLRLTVLKYYLLEIKVTMLKIILKCNQQTIHQLPSRTCYTKIIVQVLDNIYIKKKIP